MKQKFEGIGLFIVNNYDIISKSISCITLKFKQFMVKYIYI